MKRVGIEIVALICLLSMSAAKMDAKVKFAEIFTDHMVLQQNSTTGLWGSATPNTVVTVKTSWNSKTYKTTSDESGYWRVDVETSSAGGPYQIIASDGQKSIIDDILLGEVWLCSGQSNMEYRFSDMPFGYEDVYNTVDSYSEIRFLHIDNKTSFTPERNATVRYGGWEKPGKESLFDFSCVAYYFGKHLRDSLKVPIGLIESAWGATFAENWISEESLATFPYYKTALDKRNALPKSRTERDDLYQSMIDEWCEIIDKDNSISALTPEGWGEVQVPGYVEYQGIQEDGIIWLRKEIDIPRKWAGKDLYMDLQTIDDHDFTYFNGVEIGHTEGCASMRLYKVPGYLVKAGKATISIRVVDIVGYAGLNGRPDRIRLYRGKDEINLSGTWEIKCTKKLSEIPSFPEQLDGNPFMPSVLYNAMINPLVGYQIKGAIWYQGESNTAQHAQYASLMTLLINDWRSKWGSHLHFYIAQLANLFPIQSRAEDFDWAYLREAQADVTKMSNVGLAVLVDIGDDGDIHPKNKYDVGKRLALNALYDAYDYKIPYSGPEFIDYTIDKSEIVLYFNHCYKGMVPMKRNYRFPASEKDDVVRGFYVAGVDRVFHEANAIIEGNTIRVSSDKVMYPVAVRYGWANNPIGNVYNTEGLPMIPFRTDRWEQTTPGNF